MPGVGLRFQWVYAAFLITHGTLFCGYIIQLMHLETWSPRPPSHESWSAPPIPYHTWLWTLPIWFRGSGSSITYNTSCAVLSPLSNSHTWARKVTCCVHRTRRSSDSIACLILAGRGGCTTHEHEVHANEPRVVVATVFPAHGGWKRCDMCTTRQSAAGMCSVDQLRIGPAAQIDDMSSNIFWCACICVSTKDVNVRTC